MKKLTKANIEELAKEIRRWASKNKLGKDWSLFYNGIRLNYPLERGKDGHYNYRRLPVKEEANPLDYCEYYSDKFIMGMSYDGIMYECINGYRALRAYDKLEAILENYGLYIEHCDSCHCEFVNADNDEVEFYKPERKRILRLYGPGRCLEEHNFNDADYHHELDRVMEYWMTESTKVGDKGACTLGEYIEFEYKGTTYRMSAQTPYQGEFSWREPLPGVKAMLADMGANNVYVNYGRLD